MELRANSIRDHVGSTSFQRGREYFISGHVLSCTVEDGIIYGKISGSQRTPYETEFAVEDREIVDSTCSCPIGGSCKHVAALALKALVHIAKTAPTPEYSPRNPMLQPKSNPQWMHALSQLLEKKSSEKKTVFQAQLLLSFTRGYTPYDYEEMPQRILDIQYGRYGRSDNILLRPGRNRYGSYNSDPDCTTRKREMFPSATSNGGIYHTIIVRCIGKEHPEHFRIITISICNYWRQDLPIGDLRGNKSPIPKRNTYRNSFRNTRSMVCRFSADKKVLYRQK